MKGEAALRDADCDSLDSSQAVVSPHNLVGIKWQCTDYCKKSFGYCYGRRSEPRERPTIV